MGTLAFNVEEKRRVRELITTFLEIGYPDSSPSEADIAHSALLERLLDGKAPVPFQPPQAYSYPWYQLIDEGKAEYVEADFDVENGEVTICQSPWRIIETLVDDEAYIIGWGTEGLEARLSRRDDIAEKLEELSAQVEPINRGKLEDSVRRHYSWRLELTAVPEARKR